MLTKGRVRKRLDSLEAIMKPVINLHGSSDVNDLGPRALVPISEVADVQPTFSLTFSIGTPMREIHDAVIKTVLQYTRSNRLRAAQMLQINPRTIRRRLGRKESVNVIRAA